MARHNHSVRTRICQMRPRYYCVTHSDDRIVPRCWIVCDTAWVYRLRCDRRYDRLRGEAHVWGACARAEPAMDCAIDARACHAQICFPTPCSRSAGRCCPAAGWAVGVWGGNSGGRGITTPGQPSLNAQNRRLRSCLWRQTRCPLARSRTLGSRGRRR